MSTTALTPISLDKDGLPMIRTIEDAFRMADMVFQSGLAPYCFKNPQAILVAWSFGAELGLSRMQSLFNIAVVGNKPAIYGKAIVGVVQSKGVLESMKEWIEGEGDNMTAICTVKRKGFADEVTKRFSVADAKAAKLWGKVSEKGNPSPWVLYPKDMLGHKARARAFGVLFGDVLCGLSVYEDVSEVLTVGKNERIEVSQQPPAEVIHDPLMDQIGASEVVPAEKPKRARKEKPVEVVAEVVAEVDDVKLNPVTEESALAAENAHALGVPPEDIPPTQADFRDAPFRGTTHAEAPEKPVNSPGITVKPEAPVYACKSCQDKKVNSRGGPCPLCAPKKFDVQAKEESHAPKEEKRTDGRTDGEKRTDEPKPLKNQADSPKSPPVEIREVTFEKPPVALGKSNFKYVDDEGLVYYSNATGVKSVVDANIGVKISIGVQEIESRVVIVSARQI